MCTNVAPPDNGGRAYNALFASSGDAPGVVVVVVELVPATVSVLLLFNP